MLYLFAFILIILNLLTLSYVFWKQPFYPDDGNWFYYAIFKKEKKLKLCQNYRQIQGYFGLKSLFSFFYNLPLFTKEIEFFKYFKIVWYSLTSLSLYFLSYIFWHNFYISFLSGFLFMLIMILPNSKFFMTYAEVFIHLPINLSLSMGIIANQTGNLTIYILAGILSAWATQMKIIALVIFLPLFSIMINSSNILLAITFYLSGFLILYMLPFLFPKNQNKIFVKRYFEIVIVSKFALINTVVKSTFKKFLFFKKICNKIFSKLSNSTISESSYVKDKFSKNKSSLKKEFHNFMLPVLKINYFIILLAGSQIINLFFNFDIYSFYLLLFFISMIISQQVQKSYYPGHFNQIWSPIIILAAKTLFEIYNSIEEISSILLFVLLFLIIEIYKMSKIIFNGIKKENRILLGNDSRNLSLYMHAAKDIGEYIKNSSDKNDKVLAWGNMPTVNIYAKRELYMEKTHIYNGNNGLLDPSENIFFFMVYHPPEWIVFVNLINVKNKWNYIKNIEERIKIPYILKKTITLKDKNKYITHFPIYRRDDKIFREILIDFFRHYKKTNYSCKRPVLKGLKTYSKNKITPWFGKSLEMDITLKNNKLTIKVISFLDLILKLDNNDIEAIILKEFYVQKIIDNKKKREIIKNKISESLSKINRSRILRMIAEIEYEEKNLDEAEQKFKEALELNDSDFRIYNSLGEIEYDRVNVQEAFNYFNKAFEINKYSAEVYNNLAVMMFATKNTNDAKVFLNKALKIWPEYEDAKNNLEDIFTN